MFPKSDPYVGKRARLFDLVLILFAILVIVFAVLTAPRRQVKQPKKDPTPVALTGSSPR